MSSANAARRPRGFQPAEVNKPKSSAGVNPKSLTDPLMERLRMPTATSPGHGQGSQSDDRIVVPVQKGTEKPSEINLRTVNVNTVAETNSSESSSIPIIVEDQPQKSCWTRALPPETPRPSQAIAAEPTWDNSQYPVDCPSWIRDSFLPPSSYSRTVNANFFTLPPYKSPFKTPEVGSSTKAKHSRRTPSSSDHRQMTSIVQDVQSSKKMHADGAGSQNQSDAVETAKVPAVDGSPEKLNVDPASVDGSTKVAPHLRAKSTSGAASATKDHRAPMSQSDHLAPYQESSNGNAASSHAETTAEQTIAAMKNYKPPPHLQGRAVPKPAVNLESTAKDVACPQGKATDSMKSGQTIDVDEEIAAGYRVADIANDAEIAVAVATGGNENDEHFAAAIQEDLLKTKQAHQHSPNVLQESQDSLNIGPPHLRKSKPKTAGRDKKPGASQAQPLKEVSHSRQKADRGQSLHSADADGLTRAINKGKGKVPTQAFDTENSPADLLGWDGKMAPAPLGDDWENRTQFKTKDEEKLAVIKTWTEDQAADVEAGLNGNAQQIIAHIDTHHPETIPNPDEFNQAKRHVSANHRIEAYEARRSASGNSSPPSNEPLTKDQRRENRRIRKELMDSIKTGSNQHAPEANIYLRPAEMKDMRQVMLLHNHYVLKTACANELTENDELYWRSRLQETFDENDPFLVAIHKGQKAAKDVQDVRRKKSETVVGFAFAADYGLSKTAYRFTVELELWVHHAYVHQGIGKSMLDRMLAALDPGYNLLECAPLLGKYDATRWSSGGQRTIKTILVNLLHSKAGEKNLEWMKQWLTEKNFEYQGTLSEIGFKFGKP